MDGTFEEGGWNFAHLALSHFASLFPSSLAKTRWRAAHSQVTISPLFLAGSAGPTVENFSW